MLQMKMYFKPGETVGLQANVLGAWVEQNIFVAKPLKIMQEEFHYFLLSVIVAHVAPTEVSLFNQKRKSTRLNTF